MTAPDHSPALQHSPALEIARAYHRSWTTGDVDAAMAHLTDDFVCRAPDGEIKGRDAYRDYLGGFLRVFTGATDIAAFGDDEHALLFYYPQTETTSNAPAAEYFTVHDGLIVESLLVFDRLSYAPPEE